MRNNWKESLKSLKMLSITFFFLFVCSINRLGMTIGIHCNQNEFDVAKSYEINHIFNNDVYVCTHWCACDIMVLVKYILLLFPVVNCHAPSDWYLYKRIKTVKFITLSYSCINAPATVHCILHIWHIIVCARVWWTWTDVCSLPTMQ